MWHSRASSRVRPKTPNRKPWPVRGRIRAHLRIAHRRLCEAECTIRRTRRLCTLAHRQRQRCLTCNRALPGESRAWRRLSLAADQPVQRHVVGHPQRNRNTDVRRGCAQQDMTALGFGEHTIHRPPAHVASSNGRGRSTTANPSAHPPVAASSKSSSAVWRVHADPFVGDCLKVTQRDMPCRQRGLCFPWQHSDTTRSPW